MALSNTLQLEIMLNKIKKHLPIIFIILLSFTIRLININQSLWLDEAAQALESARPTVEQFDIVGDFQPPLLHLIVHLFYQFSSSDWFLRLPSVIAGVITIVFAYKIAKLLYSQKVAFLTGVIGATSPYHYYFSQELRQYSLAAMWASISMWYFINWKQSKSNKLSWGYILSSIAGMYSMYVFPFLIWFQLIHTAIFKKNKLKSLLKHILIVALAFIPWLPMFLKQLSAGVGLKDVYVGWSTAVSLPWFKSLPLTAIRFIIGMIPVDLNVIQIIIFLVLFSALSLIIKPAIKQNKSKVLVCWLISPVVWSFLFSFVIPILEPKRVLFVLPALWILISAGVYKFKFNKIIIAIILLTQIILLSIHIKSPTLQRENWKQAVSYVEDSKELDKAVIFTFPDAFAPWRWYSNNSVPYYATKILTVPDINYLDESIGKSLDHQTIYVFEYLMGLSDPNRYVFSWLEVHGYTNTQILDFQGVGFIYVYQKQIPLALR